MDQHLIFGTYRMRGSRGGTGGQITSLKDHKNIGFLGNPEKSQSYQARIQCWATIGTPAKHHLTVDSPYPHHQLKKSLSMLDPF